MNVDYRDEAMSSTKVLRVKQFKRLSAMCPPGLRGIWVFIEKRYRKLLFQDFCETNLVKSG